MNIALLDEKKVRANLGGRYDQMRNRAKPKYWSQDHKNPKMRGRMRQFGVDEIPFSRKAFVAYIIAQFPPGGVMKCPYCVAIGKPINWIDLTNCVVDHKIPMSHMLSERDVPLVLSLENCVPVCADCNNLKGSFTYPFFVGLLAAVWNWSAQHGNDQRDTDLLFKCLRTHGVTISGGFGRFGEKAKPEGTETLPSKKIATPKQPKLKLQEMW